jgi:predicted ester cyclase
MRPGTPVPGLNVVGGCRTRRPRGRIETSRTPPQLENPRMSPEDNKAVIRQMFREVWTGDVAAADRYYAPGPLRDGLKEFASALYRAVPDWRVTIEDIVAEGDKVAVRWTGRGTHLGEWEGLAATGRAVTTTGIDIERLVDGCIVEEDGQVDMAGFLRQLESAG